MLTIPALLSVIVVIWNPNGLFLTLNDQLDPVRTQEHGPLFWVMIVQLFVYAWFAFFILLFKLRQELPVKYRMMVKTVLNGLIVLISSAMLDLAVNIIIRDWFGGYIPLISVGMLVAAIYIAHSISYNKIFDIIQIVQRDIMNTISTGILVLDENDLIVEANNLIKPYMNLRIGDTFNFSHLSSKIKSATDSESHDIVAEWHRKPMERLEFELSVELGHIRHVIMRSAPILNDRNRMIGRVLTFQNVTELRELVEETNAKNELLQQRNQEMLVVQDELYRANKKLEYMAITDGLTGCYNRRYLLEYMEHNVAQNARYGNPFAIFIFDLDHFKTINDRYGHLAGDEVLLSTVEAVRGVLRDSDIIARFGGEEFTVYLPNTNRVHAIELAEKVKETVEQNKVLTASGGEHVSITISMGVISVEKYEDSELLDPKAFLRELLSQADVALYEAKYSGRNRIVRSMLA